MDNYLADKRFYENYERAKLGIDTVSGQLEYTLQAKKMVSTELVLNLLEQQEVALRSALKKQEDDAVRKAKEEQDIIEKLADHAAKLIQAKELYALIIVGGAKALDYFNQLDNLGKEGNIYASDLCADLIMSGVYSNTGDEKPFTFKAYNSVMRNLISYGKNDGVS